MRYYSPVSPVDYTGVVMSKQNQETPISSSTRPLREHKEMLDGKRFPILEGISAINLSVLNNASHVMHVSGGVEMLHEGDAPHDLYFVLDGKLSVRKKFGETFRVLAHLNPGDIYGEFGLVQKKSRYASVFTDKPSRIIRVDTAAAQQVLQVDTVFRYHLNELLKYRMLDSFFSVHPIFQNLPADVRGEFARDIPVCFSAHGERIFAQGDSPKGIFIILSGEVEMHYLNPAGVDVLVEVRRDSDMFGELTQDHGKALAYSATAATDLDMIIMNQEAMNLLKKHHPATAKNLDHFVRQRTAETLERLKENPG